MSWRFFSVVAKAPEAGEEALNAFCAAHRVVSVDRQFVAQGDESFWAICVSYLEAGERAAGSPGGRRDRIDYREVLGERDFAVYAALRSLRKTLSDQEGTPPYALFTNEQLAEMVTRRVTTLPALGEIAGIGKARLDKYGSLFLESLQKAFAAEQKPADEAPSDRSP